MNNTLNNGFGSWVIRFRWLIILMTLLLVLSGHIWGTVSPSTTGCFSAKIIRNCSLLKT